MYKVYLSNNKVYSSEDTKWMNLPDLAIEKIEFFIDEKNKIVLAGWEQYVVLKEMEAIIGMQKPNMVSMSIIAKYRDKAYQFTHNLVWNKIGQSINVWGKEYRPMGFNWKKQQWVAGEGRPINKMMWHDGVTFKNKPTCKMEKM